MDPMRTFLTEENIALHREYMRSLRLKHSVMEKSISVIKNASLSEISKAAIKKRDKDDVLANLSEYLMHDLYFKSFSEMPSGNKLIKKYYSSDEAFLYEIFCKCRETPAGFILIYLDDRGRPQVKEFNSWRDLIHPPRLAIDVSEHSYFLDYGFEREKYLKNALSHLDLAKLKSGS